MDTKNTSTVGYERVSTDSITDFDCGKFMGYDIYTYRVRTSAELRNKETNNIDMKDSDLCSNCYRELLEWFIEPVKDKFLVEKNGEDRLAIKKKEKTDESN